MLKRVAAEEIGEQIQRHGLGRECVGQNDEKVIRERRCIGPPYAD